MANLLREYVKTLTEAERLSIIDSYEEFQEKGVIGDEPIRTHTQIFLDKQSIPDTHITLWMRELAFECYRHYSKLYRAQASKSSLQISSVYIANATEYDILLDGWSRGFQPYQTVDELYRHGIMRTEDFVQGAFLACEGMMRREIEKE